MISWLHIFWIIPISAILGFIACGLMTANKLDCLQRQVDSRIDVFCKDCDYFKRLSVCNEKLHDREAYVRMLEDRIDKAERSKTAMGLEIQKRTWGRV